MDSNLCISQWDKYISLNANSFIFALLMSIHESYMKRCLQLAELALGKVAPNPLVGALLVHDGRVIGEGYHRHFGGPHAEIDCLHSVKVEDREFISRSTMYVSLEPCAHFGKTPPCADRIIKEEIPKVVIGCRDPFPKVNGRGIEKLRSAGIEVDTGLLEKECREMNRRFFTFHTKHRPYIILKWAQTADGRIANEDYSRLQVSNEFSNHLVHRWRSEESSILVGTNTALFDDPALTTRLWPGKNPVRLVVDMDLRLPSSLQLFSGDFPTIIFNQHKNSIEDLSAHSLPWEKMNAENPVLYYQVSGDTSLVHQIINALYHLKIQTVLVEGGAFLLQSFIDENSWDEARIITNRDLNLGQGIKAPRGIQEGLVEELKLSSDLIQIYRAPEPETNN
jgi:diaminohydroxyphosphoribosylaminopyrimidine deaminase/5-amino-6-(5-phosphoribosylamino)uracil reductase